MRIMADMAWRRSLRSMIRRFRRTWRGAPSPFAGSVPSASISTKTTSSPSVGKVRASIFSRTSRGLMVWPFTSISAELNSPRL